MKSIANAKWTEWLSHERDKKGNAKLKENTPEEIKKQYEKFRANYQEYKSKFFAEYEKDK